MRPLPDLEMTLHSSRDFIFSSELVHKAFQSEWPSLPFATHALIQWIHQLADSCQFPEFTEHGLPHICSLVERIELWTLTDGKSLVEILTPDQASKLLIATLIHDLGMMSQRPIDMPEGSDVTEMPGYASDIATWVRRTHVPRLPRLLARLLECNRFDDFRNHRNYQPSVDIAYAHSVWPWAWSEKFEFSKLDAALASIVSVSDLLDEDPRRCDSKTLLEHREGSVENRAHWIRHALTKDRVYVKNGTISVEMLSPPDIDRKDLLTPVYSCLRNHYKLVLLYSNWLSAIGAAIENVNFSPSTGVPNKIQDLLECWNQIPGFRNAGALSFNLLGTFMDLARKDERFLVPGSSEAKMIKKASLEDVDLDRFLKVCNRPEPRNSDEQAFYAMIQE